jgi:site-specific recombinase XerD
MRHSLGDYRVAAEPMDHHGQELSSRLAYTVLGPRKEYAEMANWFLETKARQGLSTTSIRVYAYKLAWYLDTLAEADIDFASVSPERLPEILLFGTPHYPGRPRGGVLDVKRESLATSFVMIRSFYRSVVRSSRFLTYFPPGSPANRMRAAAKTRRKDIYRMLDLEEEAQPGHLTKEFLAPIEPLFNTAKTSRELLILLLLYDGNMRLSEMAELTVGEAKASIHRSGEAVESEGTTPEAMGTLRLSKVTGEVIGLYLSSLTCPVGPDDPLLRKSIASQRNQPMTAEGIMSTFRSLVHRAGVKCSIRSFRNDGRASFQHRLHPRGDNVDGYLDVFMESAVDEILAGLIMDDYENERKADVNK